MILTAGILPFVAFEVVLRARNFGYPTGFFTPVPDQDAFESNARFGWRFFPASMARVPVVSRVEAHKPAGTFRIFILGDSAAMGIPEPAFSFGRMLRVMLEARYPGTRFEVVNTAMTAINSNVLIPVARDSARLQPDLFIVLAGNNEVVGPYGPGTVLAGYSPALWLIRSSVWFKSTRTAQLMDRMWTRGEPKWGGMAMFEGHQVTADDPRLRRVYDHFRANLESVVAIGRSAGAEVILSTVPVNLKDTPPFASAAAQEQYRQGHLAEARDLDTLRFRADSKINQVIRDVPGVRLVDAERAFGPAPGNDLFYEHVHLRFAGNYRLAQTMLPQVEAVLRRPHGEVNLSEDEVARALAFTEWDRDKCEMEMLTMMQQPPFHPEASRAAELEELQRKWASPERLAGMGEHFAQYGAVLARHPRDIEVREILAELLSRAGDDIAAVNQYRSLIELLPDVPRWHANLAYSLLKTGHPEAARTEAERALREDPQLAPAQFTVALTEERAGGVDQAISRYESIVAARPDYADASLRLGVLLGKKGRYRDAVSQYESYLKLRPGSPSVENNVGVLLVRLGNAAAAVPHYREALRLEPRFPEAANNLGAALERLNQREDSIVYYRMALSLRPGFAEARQHLENALARR